MKQFTLNTLLGDSSPISVRGDMEIVHSTETFWALKDENIGDKVGNKKYWIGHVATDGVDWYTLTTFWQETSDGSDSKKQTSAATRVKQKNVGKSNETSLEQQAYSELNSIVNKQRDKKYRLEGEELDSQGKNYPLPMLAHVYEDKKHKVKFPVFAQPKYDGCLQGHSKIETDIGGISIRDIVENKLKVNVLSFNEKTSNFEYKPIINWFNNGKASHEEWWDVKTTNGLRLRCTGVHKFYTNNGWIEAKNLDSNIHKLYINQCSKRLSGLITGTLLGDSSLIVEKRGKGNSYRLGFCHCNDVYFNFKLEIMKLCGKVKSYVSGCGSNGKQFVSESLTLSGFEANKFYYLGHERGIVNKDDFTLGARKTVSSDFLVKNLTLEGLSLWIADDGTISYNNNNTDTPLLTINTQNHSLKQIDEFVDYFKKTFDCTPSVYTDKRVENNGNVPGKFIRFNSKDTLFILNKLRKFHVKGVEKKFYFPTEDYIKPCESYFEYTDFILRRASKMIPATKYDIEVDENHNYIANGIVVHNCRALSDGKEMWSRKGKQMIPKIVEHLMFDTQGYILDGELIMPEDCHFQDSMSAAKKYDPNLSPRLLFRVYDVIHDKIFSERFEILKSIVENAPSGVVLSETVLLHSDAELDEYHVAKEAEGWEGSIVRVNNEGYKINKRTNQLLKKKSFKDDEFEVIGVETGSGKFEGLGILVLKTKTGAIFRAVPEGTAEFRKSLYQNPEKVIGKMWTVKFIGYTKNDNPDLVVPHHATAIAERDYDLQG